MSKSTPTKVQLELDVNEAHAIAAGLRLLVHFNRHTCLITDKGGCPSHVRMEKLEELAAEGGKPLKQRELAALLRRVRNA